MVDPDGDLVGDKELVEHLLGDVVADKHLDAVPDLELNREREEHTLGEGEKEERAVTLVGVIVEEEHRLVDRVLVNDRRVEKDRDPDAVFDCPEPE